jgi:glucoamylase
MRFVMLSSLCYCALVWAHSSVVDQYVATESPIAKAGLLANIGPSGSKAAGAAVRTLIH